MAWEVSPWRPFEFERMRREMDVCGTPFDEKSRRKQEERANGFRLWKYPNEERNRVKAEIPGMTQKTWTSRWLTGS